MTPSLIFNISGKADLSAFKAVSLEASRLTTGFRSFNAMLGTVRNSFAAFGAATGVTLLASAGIGAVKKQLNDVDAIMKRSEKWGISAENIVKLQYAAELADVPIEQLNVSMNKFNEYLAKQGLVAADTFEELAKVADRYNSLDSAQKKAALSKEMFGKGGAEMIPLLNAGGDAIRKMGQEVTDLGLVFDEQAGKQIERFNDSLKRLSKLSEGAARQFATGFADGLESIAKGFESINNSGFFKTLGMYGTGIVKMFGGGGDNWILEKLLNNAGFNTREKESGQAKGPILASKLDTWKVLLDAERTAFKNAETDEEKIANLTRQRDLVKQIKEFLGEQYTTKQMGMVADANGIRMTEDEVDYQNALAGHLKEQLDIEKQIEQMRDAERKRNYLRSFQGQLGAQSIQQFGFMADINGRIDEMAARARDAASIITSTLGQAFQSIGENITGLVMGTVEWGQALANIGRSILTQLVSSIVNFFVQLAARALLTALIGTAITNAAAAAASAAWAGPAVLASIATYGAAAGVGTGAVMSGLASGIPAATAASIVGGKGYAEGGLVRGGEQFVRINERGPEFVFNANAVKFWGTQALSQMNRGQVPQQVQQGVRVVILDDRSRFLDAMMRDPKNRAAFIDLAQT